MANNLDEIKTLRSNANAIYDLFQNQIPKWEGDKKHYDKTGWGFNDDDRFRASESVSIFFSSYMGTYGNSGCSSKLILDSGLFRKHLLRYLNINKKEIMLAMALQMEQDAKKLKDAAEAEVQKQLMYLKELDEVPAQ